jgi:hypothetical protein
MRRWKGWGLVALAVVMAGLGPGALLAQAAQVPGTAATITAVDDFGATLWGLAKGTPGKIGAFALMAGGASKLGGRQANGGQAAAGLLGGGALAFLPGVTDGMFTSAPAATMVTPGVSAGWQFVVGFLGGRLLDDHLFLLILGAAVYWAVRTQPSASVQTQIEVA